VEAEKLSHAFFRTMAAQTKGTKNAFVARYPASVGKMLDKDADLIIKLS
jgi:hypothetical protein